MPGTAETVTWRTSSAPCKKNGLTLIEVIAAIALLGALLSATLVAVGRHTRQVRQAQDRIEALEAADRLLSGWFLQQGGELDALEGVVPGHADWRWSVSGAQPEEQSSPAGAHVARLAIYDHLAQRGSAPLASLEFVSVSTLTRTSQGPQP